MSTANVPSGPGQAIAPYVLQFFVTFQNLQGTNISLSLSAIAPNLIVTEKATQAILSSSLVSFADGGIPLPVQPVLALYDNLMELVVSDSDSHIVIAELLGGNPRSQLLGNFTIQTRGGLAVFTDLAVDLVGTGYWLRFSSGSVFPPIVSSIFNIKPGLPSALVLTVQPSTTVAGVRIQPFPRIDVRDHGGNVVPVSIQIAISLDGIPPLDPSVLAQPFVSTILGVAVFDNITLFRSSSNLTLVFYSGTSLSVRSVPFDILAAPAFKLAVLTHPQSSVRGMLFPRQPRVAIQDQFGNVASLGDSVFATVRAIISVNSGSGTLGGTTTRSVLNGSAGFSDLSINNPGTGYVLRFLISASIASNQVDSATFNVSGPAVSLTVLRQPASSFGGQALSVAPQVALMDSNSITVQQFDSINITAVVFGNPAQGQLSPSNVAPDVQDGRFVFSNLRIDRAGSGYTLKFIAVGPYLHLEAVSQPFDILIGQPQQLVYLQQPSTSVSAIEMHPAPIVGVADLGRNIVNVSTALEVDVLNSSNLMISSYAANAINGVANLSHTFNVASASFRLAASAQLAPGLSLSIVSLPFDVLVGEFKKLFVIVQPGPAISGLLLSRLPVVAAQDAGGNIVTGHKNIVSVSRAAGPSGAYVLGTLLVTPDDGIARFNDIKISDTAKLYQLRFVSLSADQSQTFSVDSAAFSVSDPPSGLVLTSFPAYVTVGMPFNATFSLLDQFSETVDASSDSIFANVSSGPQRTLVGRTSLTFSNGIAYFSDLLLAKAGNYRVLFFMSQFQVSQDFQVIGGTAISLQIVTQPADCMNGTVFFIPPSIQTVDIGGNRVFWAGELSVILLQNHAGSKLTGTLVRNNTQGVVRFDDLVMSGLGNGFTLIFRGGLFSVESDQFSVNGEPNSLALISFPTGAVNVNSQVQFLSDIRVALLDQALNVITGGTTRPPYVAITAYVSPNVVLATAPVNNGIAQFSNLNIPAGAFVYEGLGMTINFRCNVSCSGITSPYFFVSPGTECRLRFLQQPSSLQIAGAALQPPPSLVVETFTSGRFEPVRGSNLKVGVTIQPRTNSSSNLTGTTFQLAAAGVFTFTDLAMNTASEPASNGYYLVFSMSPRLSSESGTCKSDLTGDWFKVRIGDPVSLAFVHELQPSTNGLPFSVQPCLSLTDAGGNLVGGTRTLSALLVRNSTASLLGTPVVSSQAGIATFTDLAVSGAVPGELFLINFTSGSLSAASRVFAVDSGDPFNISVVVQPTDAESMVPMLSAPSVLVLDAGGAYVKDSYQVTATLLNGNYSLAGNVVAVRNGRATFPDLAISRSLGNHQLVFGWSGVVSPPSISFSVFVGSASALQVGVQPSSSILGVEFLPTPSVFVVDAGGNLVFTSNATVAVDLILSSDSSSIAAGSPSQIVGFQPAIVGSRSHAVLKGRASFVSLSINGTGLGLRLRFFSSGLANATSFAFNISGPPAVFDLVQQPACPSGDNMNAGSFCISGRPFTNQPILRILDFEERLVQSLNIRSGVSASGQSDGLLSGNLVADVVDGLAIFTDLKVTRLSSNVRLTFFSVPFPQVLATSTQPISILSGVPNSITVVIQPSSSGRGLVLGQQPSVSVSDVNGNIVSWYDQSLSCELFSGVQNRTFALRGNISVAFNTSLQIAKFTDLSVDDVGNQFRLRFRTYGLQVDSIDFAITVGTPDHLQIFTWTRGAVFASGAGLLYPQPVVMMADAGSEAITSFTGFNCSGPCAVQVQLICCPVDPISGLYNGTATLVGNTTAVARDGLAAFTDLRVGGSGGFTLRFVAPAVPGVSPELSVQQGSVFVQTPASLAVSVQPGQAVLGLQLRLQPVISVVDGSGQTVNASRSVVTVTIAANVTNGCSAMVGNLSAEVIGGLAAFTDLAITASGVDRTCQLNFTAGLSLTGTFSAPFSVSNGPSQLLLQSQPTSAVVGGVLSMQPVLTFQDLIGGLVTNDHGASASVLLVCGSGACASTSCGLLGKTAPKNVMGRVNFTDLRVDRASGDNCTFRFQFGGFSVTSGTFGILGGSAATLRVLVQPSDAVVNSLISPPIRVMALDSGGNTVVSSNVTVNAQLWPSSPFGASLLGTTSTITANGVAIFDLIQVTSVGQFFVLKFSSGNSSTQSQKFSVHGNVSALAILDFPASFVTVGQTILQRPQVGLFDRIGILASGSQSPSNRSVAANLLSPSNPPCYLAGSTVAMVNGGFATFEDLRINCAAPSVVVRFSVTSDLSIFIDAPSITVRPGPPTNLNVLQSPRLAEAGRALFPPATVQVLDDFGNLAENTIFNLSVTLHSLNGCVEQKYLTGTTTVSADSGTIIFSNLTILAVPASNYFLKFQLDPCARFVQPSNLSFSGCLLDLNKTCSNAVSSDVFEVHIGNPKMTLRKQPGQGRANLLLSQQPIVHVSDGAGNLFSSGLGKTNYFLVTVRLDSSGDMNAVLSDSSGPCPCSVRLRNGVAEFTSLKIDKPSPSNVMIFLLDTLKNVDVLRSASFPVTGNPVSLQVRGILPSRITYNASLSIGVMVLDPNSLGVTCDAVTVSLLFPNGTFSNAQISTKSSLSAPAGWAYFQDLRVLFAGSNLRFRFEAEGAVAHSSYFTVDAGSPTKLLIKSISTKYIAGSVVDQAIYVSVVDSVGNEVANAGFNVSATVVDSQGSRLQDLTPQASVAGVAAFSGFAFAVTGSGYRLAFACPLPGGSPLQARSDPFSVAPGIVRGLAVATQPGPGVVGEPLPQQPAVRAVDAVGNPVLSFDGLVTATGAGGLNASGSAAGTLSVRAVNGLAQFTDISIWKVTSSASLSFRSDVNCGVETASTPFLVTGPPRSLNFTRYISFPIFGGTPFPIQPQLTVFDAFGAVVTSHAASARASLCAGNRSSSGVIVGNASVPCVAGVCDFTDLRINLIGDYVVCFESSNLRAEIGVQVGMGPPAILENINRFPSAAFVQARTEIRTDWRNSIMLRDAGGNEYVSGQSPRCLLTEIIEDNPFSLLSPRLIVKASQLCNDSYLPVVCDPYQDLSSGVMSSLMLCSRAGVPHERLTRTDPFDSLFPDLSINRPSEGLKLRISLSLTAFIVTNSFDVTVGQVKFSRVVVQPGSAICGSTWTRAPTVEANDAGGNSVTWLNTLVTIQLWNTVGYEAGASWVDVSGSLSGCNPNSYFIDGVAAFTGCKVLCSSSLKCADQTFRLRFYGLGLASAAPSSVNFADAAWSQTFTVSSSPTKLVVFEASVAATGGAALTVQPKVSFWSDHCNPTDSTSPACFVGATDPGLTVSASLQNSSLQSALAGATSIQVFYGWANFTDLTLMKSSAAQYTLLFQAGGLQTNTNVTVTVGIATSLAILEEPLSIQPGQLFDFKVALQDAGGNYLKETRAVQISFAGEFGFLLNPLLKANSADGKLLRSISCASDPCYASGFQLTVDKAPMIYSFVFSATRSDGVQLTAESSRFAVSVGEVVALQQTSQIPNCASGQALRPIGLKLVDAGGNLVFSSMLSIAVVLKAGASGQAVLAGNLTTSAVNGLAIFGNLSLTYDSSVLQSCGVHQFHFTSGGITLDSNMFMVHGSVATLSIKEQPSIKAAAGGKFPWQPIVEIRDLRGIVAYTDNVTIVAALHGSAGGLEGTVQVESVNGVAEFTNLGISAAGKYTLEFAVQGNGAIPSATSQSIDVDVGQVALLQIQPGYQPGTIALGQQAVVSQNSGGEPFAVQPRVQLVDTGASVCVGTEGFVTAMIFQYPQSRNATDANALVGNTVAPVDSSVGASQFTNLAINLRGRYRLAFIFGRIMTTSDEFEVSAGQIAQVEFTSAPQYAVFFQVFDIQPVVALKDRGGNGVLGSPWVHIVLNSADADPQLQGCSTQYAVPDSGFVQFSGCFISGAISKNFSLLASTVLTGGTVPITGVLPPLDIIGGFSQKGTIKLLAESGSFAVTQGPSSIRLGQSTYQAAINSTLASQPAVQIVDASGAVVLQASAAVTVRLFSSSGNSSGALAGTVVVVAARGVAQFTDLSIKLLGQHTLSFTANMSSVLVVNQSIVVTPGKVSRLGVVDFSPTVTAGDVVRSTDRARNPSLLGFDLFGNQANDSAIVNLTVNCSVTVLTPCFAFSGNSSVYADQPAISVPMLNGLVAFTDLRLFSARQLRLRFSLGDTSGVLPVEVFLNVTAGAPASLMLSSQPPEAVKVDQAMYPPPVVLVLDAFTNVVDYYQGVVLVAYAWSPIHGASPGGILSVQARNGVAVFNTIYASEAGDGFRLLFKSPENLAVVSRAFSSSLNEALLVPLRSPTSELAGAPFSIQPAVRLLDDCSRLVAGSNVSIQARLTANIALEGQTITQAANGVAAFANLFIRRAGSYKMIFSSAETGLLAVSGPIQITVGSPNALFVVREVGGTLTGGVPFARQPIIHVVDAGENFVNASVLVTTSLLNATASLGGTFQTCLSRNVLGDCLGLSDSLSTGGLFDAPVPKRSLGVLVFTDLSVDRAGAGYVLRFASVGLRGVDCVPLTILVGPASRLAVVEQPGGAVSGLPFVPQPKVQTQDAGGNFVDTSGVIVSAGVAKLSVPDTPWRKFLLGTLSVETRSGYANFTDLRFNIPAIYCLLSFDAPSMASARSKKFTIASQMPMAGCLDSQQGGLISQCGPADFRSSYIQIGTQPGDSPAASPLSRQALVSLRDRQGVLLTPTSSVTAVLASGSGSPNASLIGSSALLNNGYAGFGSLSIDKVGNNYVLMFLLGNLIANSQPFKITAGPPRGLRVGSLPTEWPVNTPFPAIQLYVLDAGGNSALDSSDCPSILLAEEALNGLVYGQLVASVINGSSSFANVTINSTGHYIFRFSCTPQSNLSAASAPIILRPFGNVADVPLLVAAGSGIVRPRFAGLGGDFLQPFEFLTPIKLSLQDKAGNVVRGFSGNVIASMGGSSFTVAATTSAVAGVFSFQSLYFFPPGNLVGTILTPVTKSSQSVLFSLDQSGASFQGQINLSAVVVTEPLFKLNVIVPTPSVQAGEPFSVQVGIITLHDEVPFVGYRGIVSLRAMASQALLGTVTQTVTGSTVTFQGLSFNKAESSVVLNVSASRLYASQVFSAYTIAAVGPGIPRKLSLLLQPDGCLGGQPCASQPLLQIQDGGGNSLATQGVQIFARARYLNQDGTSSDVQAIWSALSSASGIVNFTDVALSVSGWYALTFYGSTVTNFSSQMLQVRIGAAAQANLLVYPTELITSQPFFPQPVVTASDAGGNWVSMWSDNVTVRFLFNCPININCALSGLGRQPVSNGVAFFTDLSVNFAGSFNLQFKLSTQTCSFISCWGALNSPLAVIPGVASQLSVQPLNITVLCAGVPISQPISVQVQDFAGNLVIDNISYSIGVRTPFADSSILGKLLVDSVSGVSVFTDLQIKRSCGWYDRNAFARCYNLTFSTQNLAVVSSSFSVWAGQIAGIGFVSQPSDTDVGIRIESPAVQFVDINQNPVFSVPQGTAEYCGSTSPLLSTNVTISLAAEQLVGYTLLLGDYSKTAADSAVSFDGVSMNWGVSKCNASSTCPQKDRSNLKRFRLRASASSGFYVADSNAFSVDYPQPQNIFVYFTNVTHIGLTWNAPFTGPAPKIYSLLLRPQGSFVWTVWGQVLNTSIVVGPLPPSGVFEFQLCSESLLSDGCPVKNPSILVASPVQPVDGLDVQYVDGGMVSLRWDPPSIGPPPQSYRITATISAVGFESVVLDNVSSTFTQITGLSNTMQYKFRVYAKAQSHETFSAQGPSTEWITPTAAPTNVNVKCPDVLCNGTAIRLFWSPPAQNPRSYKIFIQQKINMSYTMNKTLSVVCSAQFKYCNSNGSVINATVGGLFKGVPANISLFSQNQVNTNFYALSASISMMMISSPSAPLGMTIRSLGGQALRISWRPPADSGDGTSATIPIQAYVFQTNESGAIIQQSADSLSVSVLGLVLGKAYLFSVFASLNVSNGNICASTCAPFTFQSNGSISSMDFYFGNPPYWDTVLSPPVSDQPIIFNTFVQDLFTFNNVKAFGTYAGQNLEISATGLSQCGAKLSSKVDGNPANLSISFIPTIQQLGLTFPVCFVASDQYGFLSDTRCIHIYVAQPQPIFIDPDANISVYNAVVGCPFQILISAIDLTSGAGVTAAVASEKGYKIHIDFYKTVFTTSHFEFENFSLPIGANLSDQENFFSNPATRMFKWTPLKGQDGFNFKICFNMIDSLGVLNTASSLSRRIFCFLVQVARCRYCLQPGDTLFTISQAWRTNWLNVWGGNDELLRPSQPFAFTEVVLGPIYHVKFLDTLDSISAKFSVERSEVLLWNPDLIMDSNATDVPLNMDQQLCILPVSCIP